jgi:hypothetical protein
MRIGQSSSGGLTGSAQNRQRGSHHFGGTILVSQSSKIHGFATRSKPELHETRVDRSHNGISKTTSDSPRNRIWGEEHALLHHP